MLEFLYSAEEFLERKGFKLIIDLKNQSNKGKCLRNTDVGEKKTLEELCRDKELEIKFEYLWSKILQRSGGVERKR
jgi:hypothetical protein